MYLLNKKEVNRKSDQAAVNFFEMEEEVGVVEDVLVVNGTFVL